jgi:hypothetical protein
MELIKASLENGFTMPDVPMMEVLMVLLPLSRA